MKSKSFVLRSGLLVSMTLSLVQVATVQARTVPFKEGATYRNSSGELIAARGKRMLKLKIEREVVMADDLMLRGKYADAADLYRQVLNRNAKSVPAMVGLGMALAKQFKLDGANEQFDKALSLDLRNAMAHSGKAMVMYHRLQSSSGTIIRNKEALLKNAEAEVKQGLAIDPGMPEAHYTLGNIYKEQGRFDEAMNELKEATKQDPQYSEAFAGLGIVRLQQGLLADAIQDFKQAIALN